MQNETSNGKGEEKKTRYHPESTRSVHTPEPDYNRPLYDSYSIGKLARSCRIDALIRSEDGSDRLFRET